MSKHRKRSKGRGKALVWFTDVFPDLLAVLRERGCPDDMQNRIIESWLGSVMRRYEPEAVTGPEWWIVQFSADLDHMLATHRPVN